MKAEPTVFIVDDDPRLRRSLDRLLRSWGFRTEVHGSAKDFLDNVAPARAGCLILDLKMDGMNGLQLQSEMQKRRIRLPHILISGYAEVPKVVTAMKAGAVDFLEKPFSDEQLLRCVRLAMKINRRDRKDAAKKSAIARRFSRLSNRERQVMELLVEGKSTREIALELGISTKTSDIHRANVLKKTKARNVVELLQMLHRIEH